MRHQIEASRIREREWKRLYIIRRSPEEAAAQAAKQTPRERLRETFAKTKR